MPKIQVSLHVDSKIIVCTVEDPNMADYLLRTHKNNGSHPDGLVDDGGIIDEHGGWHPSNKKSRTWEEYLTQNQISHHTEYSN